MMKNLNTTSVPFLSLLCSFESLKSRISRDLWSMYFDTRKIWIKSRRES